MSSAEEEGRRLFVGGLNGSTTDATFRAHFASFFPVANAEVKRRADGKSRWFGFVTFTSAQAAEQVFAMPSHVIDGRTVEMRRATSQGGAETEGATMPTDQEALVMRKLLLTGLSSQTSKQDIMTYFAHCGEVQSVNMSLTAAGGKKAEVVFTQAGAVDTVQLARPHSLGGVEVETCRATPLHMFGKPEADIKTLRVFLGPPEGSHKGLHGLGEEISDQDLYQYFGQFGEVQNMRQVLWEDTGKKKGYGHVEMADTDQVDKIILVRIHTLKGRQIEAKKALTREQMEQCGMERKEGRGLKRGGGEEAADHMGVKRTRGGKLATPRDPQDPAMRKMFAGNLHKDTTQEVLKTFFSEFGEVEQCYCAMNKTTGKCKGYGFVTYRLSEAVDAIQSSRPHTLLDREVDTRRAVPRELAGNPESELRSKKLYVTGLHGPKSGLNENISDADLSEHFGQFGAVLNVSQKLHSATAPQTDPSKVGKKTGYGYIEFADEDSVDKLVLIGVIQLKGAVLEARRGLTREQQEEVKSKQQMIMYPGGGGGDQYLGGNRGGGEMQGIMADMQSKMAGAGMGGMAGQMGKMSSMVAGMDGAGGALATSLNGMLKGMQGMMNTLGTTPELAASMGGMMVSMMEMCQQMMLAASKQKRQQAATSEEQYSSGAWGGSQAGYGTSGYSDYYGSGGYGSSSQGSYGGSSQAGNSQSAGYGARPGYPATSSWRTATRGKTEPKNGASRGRGNFSGY